MCHNIQLNLTKNSKAHKNKTEYLETAENKVKVFTELKSEQYL